MTSEAADRSRIWRIDASQVLVFRLREREYGIDIRRVQRCCSYQSLTRIANGAGFVEGVAILDGIILPIVDMRVAVDIERPVSDHWTAVIILELPDRTLGLVVDSVLDLIDLTVGVVKPLVKAVRGSTPDNAYLDGVVVGDGRNLILLDIPALLGDAAVEGIEKKKQIDNRQACKFRTGSVSNGRRDCI